MNTIEDFKNAPAGAIATHTDGSRAMKINVGGWGWVTPTGVYYGDKEMAYWGFTLDPATTPAPTTTREALDLAWDLAHPVKEGQVIPKGTRYLVFFEYGLREYIADKDFKPKPERAPYVRTVEPLHDPEPDWLDAPAVLARLGEWDRNEREVFIPADERESTWVAMFSAQSYHWDKLIDVTPLHPKEGQDK